MWFLYILLLILILGIIILIHEFGHFITAKKSGVHIYEFSIGMGPVIFTHKGKDNIDYNLRAFPIGGFVSMAGEVYEDDEKIDKDKLLCNKSWFKRLIILVAGVMMNFILAIVLLFVMALIWGAPSSTPYIKEVVESSPLQQSGIQDGDLILSLNGKKVKTWDKAQLLLIMKNKNDYYDFEVKHQNGEIETLKVYPNKETQTDYELEITEDNQTKKIKVTSIKIVKKDLQTNNDITELSVKIEDDEQKTYQTTLTEEENYYEFTTESDGIIKVTKKEESKNNYKLEVETEQGSKTLNVKVKKQKENQETKVFGMYMEQTVEKGFFTAIKYAIKKFAVTIDSMALTIGGLLTGKLSLNALSGPVGIYQVVGESAKAGIENVIYIIAFLSINVGFINILPFPAFDGGHVLFMIIEKIKGSKVNSKLENAFHTVGFILLLILMLYITFQDILRLF